MRFTGQTIVITGAGSGIGAQTARRFAAEGANIVIADIDVPAARAVATSIDGAIAVGVDVSSRSAVRAMVDASIEHFGAIDVLVNNAMSCSDGAFLDLTPEQIRQDIDVSLIGPMFASQEVLPGMVARGAGVILNVASVNGLAHFGNEAYSAAKAGLISLTRSVATEFGPHGVRCNAVAPGTIATEHWDRRREHDPDVLTRVSRWYPLGRVGAPDDVASALTFLASADASWITGVVLPVEGGLLAGNLEMTRTITGPPAVVEH